jgi:hypothetical protein
MRPRRVCWNCKGVNLAQRLDIQDILDWISSYKARY